MKYLALLLLCACHDTTAPHPLRCQVVAVATAGKDTVGIVYASPIRGLPCTPPRTRTEP